MPSTRPEQAWTFGVLRLRACAAPSCPACSCLRRSQLAARAFPARARGRAACTRRCCTYTCRRRPRAAGRRMSRRRTRARQIGCPDDGPTDVCCAREEDGCAHKHGVKERCLCMSPRRVIDLHAHMGNARGQTRRRRFVNECKELVLHGPKSRRPLPDYPQCLIGFAIAARTLPGRTDGLISATRNINVAGVTVATTSLGCNVMEEEKRASAEEEEQR